MAALPSEQAGIVLAHFIVSDDVERSKRFYTEVLGGRLAFSGPGGLTYVALANTLDHHQRRRGTDRRQAGGYPGDAQRSRPDSSFLNIRVRDIHAVYAEWSARGAQFLTPPKQHRVRDPLLCPRPGRLSDRGGSDDRPGRRLDAAVLAVGPACLAVGVWRSGCQLPAGQRLPGFPLPGDGKAARHVPAHVSIAGELQLCPRTWRHPETPFRIVPHPIK